MRAMPSRKSPHAHRPRELRRRVVMPARLRHGSSWSDACILNISSRGLMIHTGRPVARGTEVEVCRGDHVIVARVVWRDGGRAGLRSEDRVPIEQIVTLAKAPPLQLTAGPANPSKKARAHDRSRSRGRAIEFTSVLVIAASLAGAGLRMVESAFARPIALVTAVLDR
jgi:hypothetical protein